MYNLPAFNEKDGELVLRFVREHPFAFLSGSDAANRPVATQVPVFIDEREGKLWLSGHIMRNTDHHLAFAANPQALAVFTGPHAYVSASWYENRQQASTWNYMSVHARGLLRFTSQQDLLRILQRTTDHFENNPHSGSNYNDLSPEYIERLAKGIVAFEMEVTELTPIFKLSQNRDEKSFFHVIEQLEKQDAGAQEIARQMAQRATQLFKIINK